MTTLFADTLADEWSRVSAFPTTVRPRSATARADRSSAGTSLRQPLLAKTLERIANEGPRAFYKGPLAEQWISEAKKFEVPITAEDLEHYHVDSPRPTPSTYSASTVSRTPPSSSVSWWSPRCAFSTLQAHSVPPAESAVRIIVTTETLKYFQHLRDSKLADAPYGTIDVQKFLGFADEREAWTEIEKAITEHRDKIETAVTQRGGTGTGAGALSATGRRCGVAHAS